MNATAFELPEASLALQSVARDFARDVLAPKALQWDRDGSFVWVVREARSVRVAARPVRRAEGRVLVDGDLKAGESVVVEGVQRLRQGLAVRVIGNGNSNLGAGDTQP